MWIISTVWNVDITKGRVYGITIVQFYKNVNSPCGTPNLENS